MSAKPVATVLLFTITTLVWGSEGPISAREGTKGGIRTVKIMAQVPGVIDFVGSPEKALAVGDRVAKGQVLVQLDDVRARTDRQAKEIDPQNVKTAQLIEAASKERMTALVRLFELGAVARAEKDAAIATYHVARYEAAALRKALALAQAWPKEGPTPSERADLAVEMHCFRSPFNGVVRAIYKTRGEGVKACDAILLIEEVRE